jgi:hypothetical protein
MIPLFLLFPDGRVPSRRWRPVLWLAIAAPAVATLAFAVTPGRMDGRVRATGAGAGRQPVRHRRALGRHRAHGLGGRVRYGGGRVSWRGQRSWPGSGPGAAKSVQQVKWLAFVGVAFLIELVRRSS